MAGGGSEGKPLVDLHIPAWGEGGGLTPHKGTITYSLSPNRLRPTAGMGTKAFFNTVRRTRQQILFFAPPFLIAYGAMKWADER